MFDVIFIRGGSDVLFEQDGVEVIFPQGAGELILGLPGRQGPPAASAGVLMCQGRPDASLNLGPWYLPAGTEQIFNSEGCICGCLVAPTNDWIATIWRTSTPVGTATILAGELVGVVELFGGGFAMQSPQFANAVCPSVMDPTIESPSITLGTAP